MNDGKAQLSVFPNGTLIADRYEIISYIGEGSMGQVYCAKHRELQGHIVAMKILFPEFAEDKTYTERFKNEIFASYGVFHPNVVRAYEYMKDGELVAFTMEYVEGGDLGHLIDDNPIGMPIDQIVNVYTQMCAGVHAIHEASIIHRDLKPENILIRKDGVVKIADFGIARAEKHGNLTEHGSVVGTLNYVSPEYLLDNIVDWRSDIYALGVLGYEMLTGNLPWSEGSVYNTMTQRLNKDPEPLSGVRSDCPPELEAIVLKAMNRDIEQRYQSAADIFVDLQALSPNLTARQSSAYLQVAKKVEEKAPASDSPFDYWKMNTDETEGTAQINIERDPDPDRTIDFSISSSDFAVDTDGPSGTKMLAVDGLKVDASINSLLLEDADFADVSEEESVAQVSSSERVKSSTQVRRTHSSSVVNSNETSSVRLIFNEGILASSLQNLIFSLAVLALFFALVRALLV